MIRRPRRSPLFPSTPLFLSDNLPLAGVTYGVPAITKTVSISGAGAIACDLASADLVCSATGGGVTIGPDGRSEEHTSELQSQSNLVCRLLLEKKKKHIGFLPGQAGGVCWRACARVRGVHGVPGIAARIAVDLTHCYVDTASRPASSVWP